MAIATQDREEQIRTRPLSDLRIVRAPEARRLVGLSATRIRVLEDSGRFPRRVVLAANSVGYFEHELRDWMVRRAVEHETVAPLGARALNSPAKSAPKPRKGAAR